IANRERLRLNVASNLVESCARASGTALLPQRTDIVELRLVVVANRLELRAILLVNRLHLRLLCVGQIEILRKPAAKFTATTKSSATLASGAALTLNPSRRRRLGALRSSNAGYADQQCGSESHSVNSLH